MFVSYRIYSNKYTYCCPLNGIRYFRLIPIKLEAPLLLPNVGGVRTG